MSLMKPFGLRIAVSFLAAMIALTGRGSIGLSDDRDEGGSSAASSSAESPEFHPFHVLPRQPAIISPPVLRVKNVQGEVTDSELVLGVVVNGEARAYPINMLNGPKREIINDTLGDQPIVAIWCHLFSRRIKDQELSFELVAAETPTTVLMKDAQTQSVCDAYTGEAIEGPLKGTRLEQEIGTIAYSRNWKAFHPESIDLPIRDGNAK